MGGDRGKKPVDTPADILPGRKRWLGDSDRVHGGCLFYGMAPPFFPLGTPSSSSNRQPHDRMEVDTKESEIPKQRADNNRRISAGIKRSHQARRRKWDEDQEGRVHGKVHFDSICPPPLSWPELKHDMELKLDSNLDDIEKSIVVPKCPQPDTPRSPDKVDKYLVAAKNLIQILFLEHPVLIETGDLRDRARSLLGTTISSIVTEFCYLKVWRASPLRRLGYLPGLIWESSVRSTFSNSISSTVSSTSSSGSFTCSGSTNDSSDNNQASLDGPDKRLAYTSFINIQSVSVLDDIASIITQGGYQHLLRGAFDRHYSELARYFEIIDIENILGSYMKESVEILVNAWVRAMRIIVDVLTEMRRQLHKQNFGAFNLFKDDYFMVIATTSMKKLVASGSSICNWQQSSQNDPSMQSCASTKHTTQMILNLVMMYRALKYAMPELLALFSGQTEQIVLPEFHGLIDRSSARVLQLFLELNNLVRSQRLVMTDIGVHHVTQHITDYMRLLLQKKSTIYQMLDGKPNAFGELVVQLISSLESMLEMNSRSLVLRGQKQVFLLNNLHFMAEQVERCIDSGLVLGESWLVQRHDQLDQLITDYVEASWDPVISSFEKRTQIAIILWPHQLFDKFNSSFEMIYSVQKTWKVTNPITRLKLREAIIQKVIPVYQMQMENQSGKKQKSARYSVEHLESQLLEMFEG